MLALSFSAPQIDPYLGRSHSPWPTTPCSIVPLRETPEVAAASEGLGRSWRCLFKLIKLEQAGRALMMAAVGLP